MESIDIIIHKGYTIETYPDDVHINPRKDYDNFGSIVTWHRNYDMNDKGLGWDSPQDFLNDMQDKAFILPLYMYEHSGIALSLNEFSCQWDSGQVGFIFVEYDKLKKEFPDCTLETSKIKAFKLFQCEVKELEAYINGWVYGFKILDKDENEVDSCWGFYDYDYMVNECKDQIEYFVKKDKEKKQKQVKIYIKNHVPLQKRKYGN